MSVKLVAIGDSLTQGFQCGSISKPEWSYPAIIARCLDDQNFSIPHFTGPEFNGKNYKGTGGLPFNIEDLLHQLSDRYGARIDWLEFIPKLLTIRSYMDSVEDYWERGWGNQASDTGPLHHNLGVWGFQLGDSYLLSEQICRGYIPSPRNNLLRQIPEFAQYRTARRVLNPSFGSQYQQLTPIGIAEKISREYGGIENLIFWLGANHCLGAIARLKIQESEEAELDRLPHQRTATLWRSEHFRTVFSRAAERVTAIDAKHVFVANVPHVTISPISRGVSPNAAPGAEQDADGYYEFYTHFWIWDRDFSPQRHPHLTRAQVRFLDSVVDEYNQIIAEEVAKRGWHLVDIAQLLDRLAFRRQQGNVDYQFPPELVAALEANPATKERVVNGQPLLDTRYLSLNLEREDPRQRYQGGLFSLDAIHPTTIGYGIVAHEFLQVMQQVWQQAGEAIALQPLDWQGLVANDTLLTNPPSNLTHLRETLGFLYSQTPLPEFIQLMGGLSANVNTDNNGVVDEVSLPYRSVN